MEELISFFKNSKFQRAFKIDFLQGAFDKIEKPLHIDYIKEKCNLDYFNLSLFKERLVLLPFKHWVEMHTSQTLIPQYICWISQVSLDIYPHEFIEWINKANKNINSQDNQLICFLESTNTKGKVYFYSKEVNGKHQFNAHIIMMDSDFDFLFDDKGILNK
jgi:hypothetical protein